MKKMFGTWMILDAKIYDNQDQLQKELNYDHQKGFLCFLEDGHGFSSTINKDFVSSENFPVIDSLTKLNDYLFFSVAKWNGSVHDEGQGDFAGTTIFASTPRGENAVRNYQYKVEGNSMHLRFPFKAATSIFDYDGYCTINYKRP